MDVDSTRKSEWWRGAVLYQIYPRSFADSNGDGIGDLPGLIAHLDYVADLGVDGLWINPFYPSPMHDFGYDVADYVGVDPVFGTLADFDALVARAHALGLKVVTDLVFAHTSDQHPWFVDSRSSRDSEKADWYVWADPKPDGTPPNNWQSVFAGPAWTWDARRGQYFMHNFLSQQPQLNLHHRPVQDALLDVVRFWLDRGVDGFRLDAINFAMHDPALTDNPVSQQPGLRTRPFDFQDRRYNQSHPDIADFLMRLRTVTDDYPDRFTVAEVVGDPQAREMQAFTEGDQHLNSAYGFDFLYAPALTRDLVETATSLWSGREGQGLPSWTFSNHDAPRATSRWAQGRDQSAMARMTLLLLLSLRGMIILYFGEELGLPQADVPQDRLVDPEAIANWPLTLGRDGARTPMPWRANDAHAGFSAVEPWLPIDPRHRPLAVDRQMDAPDSLLHLTRQLIRLRRDHDALRQGSMTLRNAAHPDLLAFERTFGSQRLLALFNLGHAPCPWPADLTGDAVLWAVNGAEIGKDLPPLAGLLLKLV